MAEYVVQVKREDLWMDIATVTVPRQAHRRTVIRKALEDAEWKGENGPERVRVLDERSAHETTVSLETPDPKLVIG